MDFVILKEFCKRGHPQTEENSYVWRGKRSCLLCKRENEKDRESNPEVQKRRRDLRYQRLYGITYDEAEAMAQSQDFKCFVCKDPCTFETKGRGAKGSFALDHCHKTGIVRGLLCHRCNKVLGLAHDDFELLHSLADYLVKPSFPSSLL